MTDRDAPPPGVIPIVAAGRRLRARSTCSEAKIYPRAVQRLVRAAGAGLLVWLTQLVFYGLPWLPWNGRQAVLFDLARAALLHLRPGAVPAGLHLPDGAAGALGATALFFFTAVAGRLWCGYACPQTVYTEIFMWVEHRIEGDRSARMQARRGALERSTSCCAQGRQARGVDRDRAVDRLHLRRLLHADPRRCAAEAFTLGVRALGDGSGSLFYGLATYGNAGFLREQVCKYMCPYARFQSAMFDRDTLIVSYDAERGEPRGSRARKRRPEGRRAWATASTARCACRSARPASTSATGLQYECIGCAACIDACDGVMDKMELPARADPLRHRERPRASA